MAQEKAPFLLMPLKPHTFKAIFALFLIHEPERQTSAPTKGNRTCSYDFAQDLCEPNTSFSNKNWKRQDHEMVLFLCGRWLAEDTWVPQQEDAAD